MFYLCVFMKSISTGKIVADSIIDNTNKNNYNLMV